MLRYHEQVVEGLLRSSACLTVLGRGLGVQSVVLELARRVLEDGGADARHATRLVLLLNTPQEEAELLLRGAAESPEWQSCRERLVAVGPELGVEDRAEAFAQGGVFVVSARLLVPDLLVGRVLPEAIDGLVLNHAHSVGELSAEAFVVEIYRRKNKRGFVRAVSDRPDVLGKDLGQVEKLMQRCSLQQLEVWPRIRQEVQQCLQGPSQPDVIQKTLPLPPSMQQIQRHILNIIEGTLDELRKDPTLDLGHLAVRDSLFRSFDVELRRALDPSWQRLGPRTRRMVQDLKGIRQLLPSLLHCDAVEFLGLLESLSAADGEREAAPWLLSPDAQALHALARSRVYDIAAGRLNRTLEPHAKWAVLLDILERTVQQVADSCHHDGDASPANAGVAAPCSPEAPARAPLPEGGGLGAPSLGTVGPSTDDSGSDIEIVSVVPAKRPRVAEARAPAHGAAATDMASSLAQEGPTAAAAGGVLEPRMLVVVPNDKVKRQISSVLHRGPEATLLDALCTHLKDRSGHGAAGRARQEQSAVSMAGRMAPRAGEAALLAREAQAVERELESLAPQSALQLRRLPDGRACHPRVELVASDGPEGQLDAKLREARPHAVVLLEPSLEAVRALEAFCAGSAADADAPARRPLGLIQESATGASVVKREPGVAASGQAKSAEASGAAAAAGPCPLRAFLLVFEDSVEKYRFQQALLHESQAVDALIRARTHVTVRVDSAVATRAELLAEAPRSSRRGGGSARGVAEAQVQQRVVADMREFRSALPFMLFLRGLTIDPVTIPVGDYVLSRDICVERKAIPDLVASLASGRLFQQAQNMCHHYANPSLLIEFDPGKSFALQNTYFIAQREVDVGARDLLGKLALLVLHFPKLRLIWSPSQRFTADLFTRLKQGRYQPDPAAAAQIDASDFAEDVAAGAGHGEGGAEPQAQKRAARSNSVAFDLLRKLPGVTPRNMFALARRAGSLAGLAKMSEDALADVIGRPGARQLREFLDAEAAGHVPPAEPAQASTAEP